MDDEKFFKNVNATILFLMGITGVLSTFILSQMPGFLSVAFLILIGSVSAAMCFFSVKWIRK